MAGVQLHDRLSGDSAGRRILVQRIDMDAAFGWRRELFRYSPNIHFLVRHCYVNMERGRLFRRLWHGAELARLRGEILQQWVLDMYTNEHGWNGNNGK